MIQHKARVEELNSLVMFNLKLQHKVENDFLASNNQTPQEYFDRLQYYSLFGNEDLLLVVGGDTLLPCLYHFEHTYNLTPYNTIVFGYECEPESSDDVILIYDDQVLGSGPVKFKFDGKDIQAVPTLKLS
jgi:hypothetical protein